MRGEIWLVDLDPVRGAEANKTRPAVIVGRAVIAARALERGHGVVTVIPLTSNVERVLDFQLLLRATDTGLDLDCKAQAEQIRSVDVRRLRRRIGTLQHPTSQALDDRIRLWLNL